MSRIHSPDMAVPDVVEKYAPVVVLHRDEKLLPSSVDWFLERSRLRWATGRNLDGEAVPDAKADLDAARLGAASSNPYRHGKYVASAFTRPLDDNSSRAGDPPVEQGFFLPLRDEAAARGAKSTSRDSSLYTGATVCYDHDEGAKAITYWLFYPGSAPPLGILRAGEQIGVRSRDAAGQPPEEAPDEVQAAVAAATLEEFRRAYPELAATVEPPATRGFGTDVLQGIRAAGEAVRALMRDDQVLHEGDWERVTVYLDEADPEGKPPSSVIYYRHSTNTTRKWAGVEKDDETHPVVYCGIGSHASLPSPDFGYIDVGDRKGPRWRTWDRGNGLASVTEQPWFGFGGAWGSIGRVRDATGPLGPGAHWKRAAPRPSS